MQSTPYGDLVAYILSMDAGVVRVLLVADLCAAFAITALFSRGRRPLELLSMYALIVLTIFALATLVVHVGMDRPFFRLEVVSYP
ncbi:MAG: hypothetical protein ACI81R_000470 [Bradymonadia bacterium]|jgi:hypothetical protein